MRGLRIHQHITVFGFKDHETRAHDTHHPT